MEIRKAVLEDIDAIMAIYEVAKQFMRETGNPNQWIKGYPWRELVEEDIRSGFSHVCVEEGQLVGVFYFTQGIEPAYLQIFEGAWLNDEPYGVIHRIASAGGRKGVASFCVDWCFDKCHNLRIDTHEDNKVMQNFLAKKGFERCGIVYYPDGNSRVAFQKYR